MINIRTSAKMRASERSGKLTITDAGCFRFFVTIIWVQTILLDYFRAIVLRIPFINNFTNAIIVSLYLIPLLLSLRWMQRNIKLADCVAYVLIAFLYFLDGMLNQNKADVLAQYRHLFLVQSLPLFFIGLNLEIEGIKEILYWLSIISIYALAFYKMVLGGGVSLTQYTWSEDMSSSYYMLPHLLLVILFTIKKPSVLNVITSVFGTMLTFSFGTRAPLLIIFIFVVLYVMLFRNWKYPVRSRAMLGGAAILVITFFEQIIGLLQKITQSWGMSVRLYTYLLRGDFLQTNTRDGITNIVMQGIQNRPLTGYGFAGDRLFGIIYSHNIALELWASFGWIIGTVVLLWIALTLVRGILAGKSDFQKGFILLLVCTSFVKLLISGTYLNEPFLYLLLGYCVKLIRARRTDRVLEKTNE